MNRYATRQSRRSKSLPLTSQAGSGSEVPALVIDLAAGAIVDANTPGWAAWGVDPGSVVPPLAIDKAMPAMHRLAELARFASRASPAPPLGGDLPDPPLFHHKRKGGRGLAVSKTRLWQGRVWAAAQSASEQGPGVEEPSPQSFPPNAGGSVVEEERLTFWARRGLLRMRCEVQRVGSGPALFLVRALDLPADKPFEAAKDKATNGGAPAAGPDVAATARLAHELRTPLAAVIAYAEVLKDEHFGPLASPRYREYARHIHDSARHALGIVDGLLAGPATEAGVPELAFRDLDPAGVVENCLTVARPLAEEAGLDLIAQVCPRAPRVVADELSLKQMLLNLITNAIKFARPGDKVTVGVAYELDGPLKFAVADTGPGMGLSPPVALSPQGPGERPTKKKAGLGIGLPLTRALAEANGAALTIDSAPGRGTCVTIAFGKDRVVPV